MRQIITTTTDYLFQSTLYLISALCCTLLLLFLHLGSFSSRGRHGARGVSLGLLRRLYVFVTLTTCKRTSHQKRNHILTFYSNEGHLRRIWENGYQVNCHSLLAPWIYGVRHLTSSITGSMFFKMAPSLI